MVALTAEPVASETTKNAREARTTQSVASDPGLEVKPRHAGIKVETFKRFVDRLSAPAFCRHTFTYGVCRPHNGAMK
jgi:hypothetical protein